MTLAASAQKVMEALLELEKCDPNLGDAGVAMDASAMTVDVELTVRGVSEATVVEHAQATVRTAIHAAGHGTPDWPLSPNAAEHGLPDNEEAAAGTFRRQQFVVSA